MKTRALSLALAALLPVLSASAADLPSRMEPPPAYIPPPPMLTWTGFYAGFNIGGGWLDRDDGNWLFSTSASNTAGVIGGAQIGYNYQFTPLFVAGLETDIQGSSVGGGGWGRGVDWFGTVRGRAGVSLLNAQLLVYGTGGFAYGDLRINNWFGARSRTATGWTAGGGLEYAFLPNWSAKVEYLYTRLGANYGPLYAGPFIVGDSQQRAGLNTVRAGVNYRFNWLLAPPGPPLAAY